MRTHQDAAGPDPFANDYMALIHAHESPAYVLEGASVDDGGSTDLTVNIASGTVVSQGSKYSISSTSVTLASANSFKRYDLIVVDNSGTVTDRTGSTEKKAPDMKQGDVLLAIVEVPANASGVSNSNIMDARILTEGDARATGTTTIEGDADASGAGTIDLAIAGTTHWQVENDGDLQGIATDPSDQGATNSPVDRLTAKHDSDGSSGSTTVATTHYEREFVSTVDGSGNQTGHVEHRIGGTEALRIETDASVEVRGGPLNFPNSTNIQDAGTDAIQFDGSQNVTIPNGSFTASNASTLSGDVTLQQASTDYQLTSPGTTDVLDFVNQSSGTNPSMGIRALDSDGTDSLAFSLWGVGDISATDRERLQFIVSSDGTNVTEYTIQSRAAGTGSHHPIKIESGGNTDQLVADTNGEVLVNAGALRKDITSGDLQLDHDSDSGNTRVAWKITKDGTDTWRMKHDYDAAEMELTDANNGDTVLWRVVGGDNSVRFPNAPSTTGTNALFDSNNQLALDSGSARRRKEDIQYLDSDDVDPKDIVSIDPAAYVFTEEWGGEPDAGFIADDFVGLGLDRGMRFDDEGRVVDFGIDSRVIDAAQQVVLQDHESRIDRLERRVEEMES